MPQIQLQTPQTHRSQKHISSNVVSLSTHFSHVSAAPLEEIGRKGMGKKKGCSFILNSGSQRNTKLHARIMEMDLYES